MSNKTSTPLQACNRIYGILGRVKFTAARCKKRSTGTCSTSHRVQSEEKQATEARGDFIAVLGAVTDGSRRRFEELLSQERFRCLLAGEVTYNRITNTRSKSRVQSRSSHFVSGENVSAMHARNRLGCKFGYQVTIFERYTARVIPIWKCTQTGQRRMIWLDLVYLSSSLEKMETYTNVAKRLAKRRIMWWSLRRYKTHSIGHSTAPPQISPSDKLRKYTPTVGTRETRYYFRAHEESIPPFWEHLLDRCKGMIRSSYESDISQGTVIHRGDCIGVVPDTSRSGCRQLA